MPSRGKQRHFNFCFLYPIIKILSQIWYSIRHKTGRNSALFSQLSLFIAILALCPALYKHQTLPLSLQLCKINGKGERNNWDAESLRKFQK